MSEAAEAAAAERLWAAARAGTPCPPVRSLLGDHAVAAAYRIQRRNHARALAEQGWRPCGHKIGLTSVAVQRQLGVDQPDFGTLYAEHEHRSGDQVDVGWLLQPRVEAEVALVLAHDLDGEHPTVADVAAATAYVLPALEIVDSRIAGWDISIADTIADNASSGHHVLGVTPVELDGDGLDGELADVRMELAYDGEVVSTGTGRDSLGGPLRAARWLAETRAARGEPLRAGDVVLTGALGPVVPVRPGRVQARLSQLGTVSVEFVRKEGEPG